jgi:CheY-like chemotaxis protein
MSVLVIDDTQFFRRVVVEMCEAFGFGVIKSVGSPTDALALLEKHSFDFVIIDYQMEPLDGIQATRMIRRAGGTNTIYVPIVMMTGRSDKSTLKAALEAGVTDFVAKPLSPKTLLSRLTSIIDRPKPFIRTPEYFGPDHRMTSELFGLARTADTVAVD